MLCNSNLFEPKNIYFMSDCIKENAIFNFQIDSYEYLHSKGFVHKDVQGSNLLFGRGGVGKANAKKKNVFLVDFGLTSRYIRNGIHKPFEPDVRSAHEGTAEFTSRDAHLGCKILFVL